MRGDDGRLRVLRILARLNVGGPAAQADALHRHLDPDRFEQLVLCGMVGEDEGDFLAVRATDLTAVRVAGLGRAPSAAGDLQALRSISQIIRQFRPHVVHTHAAKAGTLGRTAAAGLRVPVRVHTFHGHLLQGYFTPRAVRSIVFTERSLARVTTRLVSVGERVRDELLAAGIGRPDQYVVVPPGVELPEPMDRGRARALLDLDGERPVVAFVARLTRVKRPDRFLEVAAVVAARRPDVLFLVAGEGDLFAETRRQAEERGLPVRFLGWCADMAAVYSAADLVLLTSDNEGMPVSLIEAAACAVPAVTTRVGSAREVVIDGRTGLVTSTDPVELADAVSGLLDDSARREEMGRAAAQRASAAYAPERLAADLGQLYESLVASRTGDRRRWWTAR